MPQMPKFDKYLNDTLREAKQAESKARHGIVMSYNPMDNTATVMMSAPNSDDLGEILKGVPCPTHIGIQAVAPDPGRPCWVVFEGSNNRSPFITHYYNHEYRAYDAHKQNKSSTGIPKFNLSM